MPKTIAVERASSRSRGDKAYRVAIFATTGFIFLQSVSAGEFLTSVVPQSAREVWKTVHGLTAYPIMGAALFAAILLIYRSRSIQGLTLPTTALSAATIVQWLSGHAISTLGWNWVIPVHVTVAFVVYGLAVFLATRVIRWRTRTDD